MIPNFETATILENDFVKLEPLAFRHLDSLASHAEKNPNLLKYSPSPFGSREGVKKYIELALSDKKKLVRYPFAIFDKSQNLYAGSTSYGNIALNHQRVEIGWTWLSKEFQGTGLNKQCKFLLLHFAFEKLNCARVELKLDSRNKQSKKAIEKLGATYEGKLRNHMLMPDGARRDTLVYSIIKDEWPSIKLTIFSDVF